MMCGECCIPLYNILHTEAGNVLDLVCERCTCVANMGFVSLYRRGL